MTTGWCDALRAIVGLTFAVSISVPIASVANTNARLSSIDAEKLDAAIGEIMRKDNLPSVVVDVSLPHGGRYVFVGGSADLETRAERRFEQPFRIASLTKTFVATAVLQLVDRGKLRKTDPLSKWYPSFPNAATITIDDLLRMRSGIAAPSDEETIDAIYDDPVMPAPMLATQMAQAARMRGRVISSNRKGVYTNLNYDILGGIVKKITGEDVGVFITSNIIKKLALRETSYPAGLDLAGGLHGYGWNSKTKRFDDKTRFNPALGGPAGAMTSNMDDLTKYVRILCRGGLLKPATQRDRLRAEPLAGTMTKYGEGVLNDGGFCGHSGTVPGFSTDMYYMPQLDATLIVSVNRLDRDDKLRSLPVLTVVAKALLRMGASSR